MLSAVLIIVAFLSILAGALMTELSSAFVVTRSESGRIATEATLDSGVEYAVGKLQGRSVPNQCSIDTPSPLSPVALNNMWATAIPSGPVPPSSCKAIVPDFVNGLVPGTYSVDGTHVNIGGSDTYLVGDSAGRVYDYLGQTVLWTKSLGAGVTAPPVQSVDPSRSSHLITLVPDGSRVAMIDDHVGVGASLQCYMPTAATVASRPGFENPPTGSDAYFADYAFLGDNSGSLYVYDSGIGESCTSQTSVSGLGGSVVGGPLVFPGTVTTTQNGRGGESTTTTTDEVFAVVNGGGSSWLVHYSYQEQTQGPGNPPPVLTPAPSLPLPFGNASGVAFSTTTPADGQSIRLAITFGGGQVALASINASQGGSGWTYTMSSGPSVSLGGGLRRAPYWCHCPGGDRIAAGDTNGGLFILNTALSVVLHYPGSVAINTTPAADVNDPTCASACNWYFGADDGFVYVVEPPASGSTMVQAARFGPGGQVRGSPVVASAAGCSGHVCLYFGSSANGSFFAQIGSVRVMDFQACLTSGSSSTDCSAGSKARLWARVEVGGSFHNVIGWTYYNSSP